MAKSTSGNCCVCGEETKERCSACGKAGFSLFFCSKEHQRMVWFAHKQFCGPNSKPFSFPPLTKEEAADLRFLLLSSSPEVFDPSVNMVMRLTTRAFGRLPQEMLIVVNSLSTALPPGSSPSLYNILGKLRMALVQTRRNLERSADGAALLRKFSTTHTDTDPVVSVSRVLVLASTEIHSQSEGASSSFPPLDEDWSVALLHHVVIFSAILEQILKTEGDSAVQRLDTGPLDPLLAAAVQPMASAILARAAHSASQARILEGAVLDVVESAGQQVLEHFARLLEVEGENSSAG